MGASGSQLFEQLRSADEKTRLAAAEALARTPRPEAGVALVAALADSSDDVRQWVSEALENLGPPPRAQLGELAALLKHANDDVAYWAATLIGRLGSDGKSARTALAERANAAGSPEVSKRARWALEKIGGHSQ
jgi:HEAT repeat protein